MAAALTGPETETTQSRRTGFAALGRPEYFVALIVSGIFGLVLSRLWVGDLLNSYAFMSNDSFDWLTQGVALVEFISGDDRSQWPILRPPLFVMVHALDHWIGTDGIVFLIVQVGALAGVSFALSRFAHMRGAGAITSFLAGLAAPLSIVGVYAVFILSDAIASSLMTISAMLALNALRNQQPADLQKGLSQLVPAILVGVAAGITQTYGMIPMLIICSVFGGLRLLSGRPIDAWAAPILAVAITGVVAFGLQILWAALIPHGMKPDTFGLLEPSLAMLPFYSNVWPLTFGLFLPILIWAGVYHLLRRQIPSIESLSLMAVVGAFAVLSFCYQWPESRMTYIYVPMFILMVLSLSLNRSSQVEPVAPMPVVLGLGATFAAVILVTLTIVPGDYWRPSIAAARFAPAQTWLLTTFSANPVDRFKLRIFCESMHDVCDRAALPPPANPYQDMMVLEYRRRMTEEPGG